MFKGHVQAISFFQSKRIAAGYRYPCDLAEYWGVSTRTIERLDNGSTQYKRFHIDALDRVIHLRRAGRQHQ